MARIVYDPKDTVNDAQALQQAINAAGPGGRVDLAQGRALLNAPLQINQALTFAGSGPGTLLARAAGFAGNLIELRNATGLVLKNFRMDDQCSPELVNAEVGAQALNFWNCEKIRVSNVDTEHGFRGGILLSECRHATVEHCLVADVKGTPLPDQGGQGKGGHGLTIHARTGFACQDITISKCRFERNWRTGFFTTGSSHIRLEGCYFEDNCPKAAVDAKIERGGQVGIWSTDVICTGNQILGGDGSQGFEIDLTQLVSADQANHIIIANNEIRGQGYTGILVYVHPAAPLDQRHARVLLSGNILDDNTQRNNGWYAGITVTEGVSDVVVTGNYIREVGQAAIKFAGKNERWLLATNTCISTGPTAFIDGNRAANGTTTGQIGVGVFVTGATDTKSIEP